MKKMRVAGAFLGLCVMVFTSLQAQTKAGAKVYHLGISDDKTTNIILPFAIKGIDRGSEAILVQKAAGAENIVQAKAAKRDFTPTNISVVTAGGSLYSFMVYYEENPLQLNLQIDKQDKNWSAIYEPGEIDESQVQGICEKVLVDGRKGKRIRDERDGITFDIQGVFIKDNVMYYRLVITNTSNIGYDISQLRFFIREQKTGKRVAVQELEQVPLYIYKGPASIPAKSWHAHVIALPKITIPDKKKLVLQLMEENGGRNLELTLKNKQLLNAVPVE